MTTTSEFIKWIPLVLDALRDLGGTATPREVCERVATLGNVSEAVRFAKYPKTGNLKFSNQVAFARQYLYWEELITSPKTGIWSLSPEGQAAHFTPEQAQELVRKWVIIWTKRKQADVPQQATEDNVEDEIEAEQLKTRSYKNEILAYLQRLQPAEFERFCADLLRHLGMVRVVVLGGAGDKGIDGMGFLPSGPIVTTKVAFQCKRYSHAVQPKDVREFRGAIGHKAEKGIFFTTDFFTAAAQEAAGEDMGKPIELIDGDRLVELLEQNQFGLQETKTFEINWAMMDGYKLESKSNKNPSAKK